MKCPRELVIEPVAWCPLRCRHCSSNSSPFRRDELKPQTVIDLIRQAGQWGAGKVSFGGGEPTSAPRMTDYLAKIADYGMKAEVFTSGIFRSEPDVEPLPVSFLDSASGFPGTTFIFSLHGATAQTHDGITGVSGSFAGLRQSLAASLARGIRCELNFVPMKPNAGELKAVLSLCEAYRIPNLSLLRFVPQGRGLLNREDLELTDVEEQHVLRSVVELRASGGPGIRTGSPFNSLIPDNGVPCRAGSAKFVVQADGNVIPCEVFKHDERSDWGLSAYTSGIREWTGSPLVRELRRTLRGSSCLICPVHSALREAAALDPLGQTRHDQRRAYR